MKAIYTVTMGRGYGRMTVPVVDLAATTKTGALHVLGPYPSEEVREDPFVELRRPLCGRPGDLVGEIIEAVDPKAEVVSRRLVCVSCRERLGKIPPVEFVKDVA